MKRKSSLWLIPLLILISLLALPVVSWGQLRLSVPDVISLDVMSTGEEGELVKDGKTMVR